MTKHIFSIAATILIFTLVGCSKKIITFEGSNLQTINRDIVSISESKNTLSLDRKKGDGMAIIKSRKFAEGTIELELKGENNPGKSFVGIAFNIQNDSTYEAVYFRPFNFQSKDKIRREHSIQYIFHPKNTWRYLRKNMVGQFEAEYPRQPMPDEWFGVRVKIEPTRVYVYDQETKTELLSVERLTEQVSNKIGMWTGFNSKGAFRNLKVIE